MCEKNNTKLKEAIENWGKLSKPEEFTGKNHEQQVEFGRLFNKTIKMTYDLVKPYQGQIPLPQLTMSLVFAMQNMVDYGATHGYSKQSGLFKLFRAACVVTDSFIDRIVNDKLQISDDNFYFGGDYYDDYSKHKIFVRGKFHFDAEDEACHNCSIWEVVHEIDQLNNEVILIELKEHQKSILELLGGIEKNAVDPPLRNLLDLYIKSLEVSFDCLTDILFNSLPYRKQCELSV